MPQNTHYTKITATLLALATLLSLTACDRNTVHNNNGDPEELSATVYVPEYLDAGIDLNAVSAGCLDGETLYLSSFAVDYATGETLLSLDRVSLESGAAEALPDYRPPVLPEGTEGSLAVADLQNGGGGTLWINEQEYRYEYDLPEDFDPAVDRQIDYYTGSRTSNIFRQLDSSGGELRRVDMADLAGLLDIDAEAVYTYQVSFDQKGNMYVVTEGAVYVLDSDLRLLCTLTPDGEYMYGGAIALSDGIMAVRRYVGGGPTGEGGYQLCAIDLETGDWSETYPVLSSYELYNGSGKYLFCYSAIDGLYGWDTDAGESRLLLDWIESGMNQSGVRVLSFLPDGRMALLIRNWKADGSDTVMQLAVLAETDRSELPERPPRTILTYAAIGLRWDMQEAIVQFNQTNNDYYIVARDYDQINGLTQLTTEILSGNVPDILDAASLPIEALGRQGYLEDLWPWIENDPDIGREGVMEHVFETAEQDGKLYQVFDSFGIATVAGAERVVGDRTGWTLADLCAALDAMPEDCDVFGGAATSYGVLWSMMAQNGARFVDWENGTCSFDSDDFKELLAFCGSFSEKSGVPRTENASDRVAAGKQMLVEETLANLQDMQWDRAVFDGAVSYVGFPRLDGGCGSSFTVEDGTPLAMSAVCHDKEGAWSFIRQKLLPQCADKDPNYVWNQYFSTNTPDFDWVVSAAMTPRYKTDISGNPVLDENGDPIEVSYGSGGNSSLMVDYYATTQAEYDQFMELYNSIHTFNTLDQDIYHIVYDLAGAYFAGDRSLDDTARLIQGRVNIYINENR